MPRIEDVERHLPDYQIDVVLGSGLTSTVYRAVQRSLGRYVAIKSFNPDPSVPSDVVVAFEAEAAMWAHFRHENLIHLYDYKLIEGTRYIILEYAFGFTMRELLDRHGAFPPDVTMAMAHQTVMALEYLHRYRIIHRDIKPANLYVTSDGAIKLTDFGTSLCPELPSSFFFPSAGSPAYMPPDADEVDQRTPGLDLYAFGILALEMWNGKHPFRGIAPKSPAKIFAAAGKAALDPLNIPALRKAVRDCLKGNAQDRGTAREKRQALEKYLSGRIQKSSREIVRDYFINQRIFIEPARLFPRNITEKVSGGPLESAFKGLSDRTTIS